MCGTRSCVAPSLNLPQPTVPPPCSQVVSKELEPTARALVEARSGAGHRHRFVTYALHFERFAGDMARIAHVRFEKGRGEEEGRDADSGRRNRQGCAGGVPALRLAAAVQRDISQTYVRTTSANNDKQQQQSQAGFLRSMFYGYRILAAMMDAVIGDEPLLAELKAIAPGAPAPIPPSLVGGAVPVVALCVVRF